MISDFNRQISGILIDIKMTDLFNGLGFCVQQEIKIKWDQRWSVPGPKCGGG